MKILRKFLLNTFIASLVTSTSYVYAAANSSDYTAQPPFVAESVGKPNVVIALDISGSMKAVAYRDVSAGGWNSSSTIHDDFSPLTSYFGYFDNTSRYSYDSSPNKRFFVEDNVDGDWDGNFLNWLTMRRMDVARKVLTGGKVRDRGTDGAGEVIDGEPSWYVIEGQHEPSDRTFRKSYTSSSLYTPSEHPDGEVFLISEGKLSRNNAGNAKAIALSSGVEIGQVSTNRSIADDGDDLAEDSDWVSVSFLNTSYSTPPAVVATGLSFFGSDPTHARVRNVTTTGFEVRLEEWAYRDINHTTEDITYIVVDDSTAQEIMVDGTSYEVRAGKITTDTTMTLSATNVVNQTLVSGYTPVVFAGVSSQNSDQPVIARVRSVNTSSFDVTLQNEEGYQATAPSPTPAGWPNHPASEEIHWVAMEPLSGIVDTLGVGLEIGTTGNIVEHDFEPITFSSSSIFPSTGEPLIAVSAQTIDGNNTGHPRYRNVTNLGFEVMIEEEKSLDDEIEHTTENVGYLAVDYIAGYNIQIGVRTEPEGIIQQNSGSMRFGVAVYNYDHSRNPTSIYDGNKVHGGTFRPCYPDVSLPVTDRANDDICLDTHVKSPLDNVINVIEDHPLIWGTTPIAETLFDIRGYFAQTDYTSTQGHVQWYDNGTEGQTHERNSYEVNNDWDPYFYEEFNNRLPCAKSFVLHFNDGAPYTDFNLESDGTSVHPTVVDDGIGAFGQNDVLDDLALELRNTDCRDENSGNSNSTGADGYSQMTGHQEIITYYVYAALGEESNLTSNSLLRMRESAVNGGFVDRDGDREPDPNHNPLGGSNDLHDFIRAGSCTESEWDNDADCNPDNFYFASDGAALVDELNAAFESIVTRAATGGASSVIAASRSGEGSVVNAIFRPFVSSGADEVTWIGDVHALMIDDAGNIRQDDGDRTLEGPESDSYLDMCSDEEEQAVRVKLSNSLASRPSSDQFAACSDATFPLGLFDINYLWSGANWLASLTDDEATTQRTYTDTAEGRYIITGIDTNADGLVQEAETVSFEPSSFPENYAGLISDDEDTAEDVINFIRGEDIDGFRTRQLDGQTMRLGDVIYSTPTIVGRPAENLDLLYESQSYALFFERYKYRRQMIYAGGNDGMVHAFNGGWYNSDTKQFLNAHGSGEGSMTNYDLGAEMWAYVPYNLLPHLEYLTDPDYGSVTSDHLYFVDLEPRIFDAKIFRRSDPSATDSKYPGLAGDTYGWGTVLVMGMRLGGGETTVDADLDSGTVDNRTLRSSIAIFDITDPDEAPRLLLEFTHADLGFTTSTPAPITVGTNNEGDGDWYLMIGSGPDTDREGFTDVESTQNGKLFLLDLIDVANQNSTVLEAGFDTDGILSLSEANSFISEIVPVDFGLDNFTTDAVYFGTVSGDDGDSTVPATAPTWDGNLYRVKIQDSTNATPLPPVNWIPQIMMDAQAPVTAPISLASDGLRNKWLFFGTGRYFTSGDNADNTTQNYYYGIKEPRDTSGNFTHNAVDTSSIVDVSSVEVSASDGTVSPAPSPFTSGDTVGDMESRMRQFSDNTLYLSGWRRTFRTSERNFGAATVLGGTLTYTSFIPEVADCSIEGDAYLYVLNALTGTAGEEPILSQDDAATNNEYVVNIGGSPATSPSLHRGEGYTTDNRTTAIIQTANGNIISVEQDNEDKVRDGEASWRQLR